jgi:class 3 adenylate cyclase
MHRALRDHLRDATGQSTFVVAVNMDIRGFSSFFSDSSQAAAYLSSAYTRILDDYFAAHAFFKPTGDGLLIVRDVERSSLDEALEETVDASLRLDREFPSICRDDPLINFATPGRVGIGLARGTATRLVHGDTVLDYSGYPLNLCSRLMDLARPHGVVFDATFPTAHSPSTIKERFEADSVYIKGLADTDPMAVYVTEDVVIPEINRRAFGSTLHHDRESIQLRQLELRAPLFRHRLSAAPLDRRSVEVAFTYPSVDKSGRRISGLVREFKAKPTDVEDTPDGVCATVDYQAVVDRLKAAGVRRTWPVGIVLSYLVARPIEMPTARPALK